MTAWRSSGILLVMSVLMGEIAGPLDAQDLSELNEHGFPLAIGNRWNYEVSASRVSVDPDDTYAFEAEAVWEIVAREQVLGQEAFRFLTTHRFLSGPDSGSVATAETWFAMQEDTLRALASRDVGGLNPSDAQLFKRAFLDGDEPDPWDVITLVLPLSVGSSWRFGVFGDADRKVVEAEEAISVPAGDFDTFRVVRTIEGIGLRSEQWFAAIGLVKMRSEILFTHNRTNERGEPIGEVTESAVTEMELRSFHLAGASTAVTHHSWGQIKKLP